MAKVHEGLLRPIVIFITNKTPSTSYTSNMMEMSLTTHHTQLSQPVVLYDGVCNFCRMQVRSLDRLSRGKILFLSAQDNLQHYPEISLEEALQEIKLIEPNGTVHGGAGAIAKIYQYSIPVVGQLARLYYLPGIRQVANTGYRWIARNRYRIWGRTNSCDGDSCALKFDLPAK